jgi:hypothetical protein
MVSPRMGTAHPSPPPRRPMTVCISSLAQKSKAIVCMSDKSLSYGESIQWDSDSSKMVALQDGGFLIMFSGEEQVTSRVLAGIVAREDELGDDISATIKILEAEYQSALQELVDRKFLFPRLFTRELYEKASSSENVNSVVAEIANDISLYRPDCAFIVSGFDSKERPFILEMDFPGVVTNMTATGFQSIGSGWEKANAKLLYSGSKKAHSLVRVMYDMFDAKAFSEMAAGVGFDWETHVITGHRRGQRVPGRIDGLIEKVWADHDRSPFEVPEPDDELPPKSWKAILNKFAVSVLEDEKTVKE